MIQQRDKALANFQELYRDLLSRFGNISFEYLEARENEDVTINIRKKHNNEEVGSIYLDNNDEFYICFSQFCASWFPCDEEKTFIEYKKALFNYLEGTGRIKEIYKSGTYTKGEFQILENNEWITLCTHYSNIWANLLIWIKPDEKIVTLQSK